MRRASHPALLASVALHLVATTLWSAEDPWTYARYEAARWAQVLTLEPPSPPREVTPPPLLGDRFEISSLGAGIRFSIPADVTEVPAPRDKPAWIRFVSDGAVVTLAVGPRDSWGLLARDGSWPAMREAPVSVRELGAALDTDARRFEYVVTQARDDLRSGDPARQRLAHAALLWCVGQPRTGGGLGVHRVGKMAAFVWMRSEEVDLSPNPNAPVLRVPARLLRAALYDADGRVRRLIDLRTPEGAGAELRLMRVLSAVLASAEFTGNDRQFYFSETPATRPASRFTEAQRVEATRDWADRFAEWLGFPDSPRDVVETLSPGPASRPSSAGEFVHLDGWRTRLPEGAVVTETRPDRPFVGFRSGDKRYTLWVTRVGPYEGRTTFLALSQDYPQGTRELAKTFPTDLAWAEYAFGPLRGDLAGTDLDRRALAVLAIKGRARELTVGRRIWGLLRGSACSVTFTMDSARLPTYTRPHESVPTSRPAHDIRGPVAFFRLYDPAGSIRYEGGLRAEDHQTTPDEVLEVLRHLVRAGDLAQYDPFTRLPQ